MGVIEVGNLYKSFKIYSDKPRTLKEKVLFKKRREFERRQVLKNINFTIEKGEVVGLIGHNGCGKSTLLKLLTKILYPDMGFVSTKGRVSSLLELGAGFHPELSGRENIYANAAIFGLKKKEVDERLDKIIAFSELEEYIDNPVRTYSSGMYTRLAFSVAINVDADILLVDEILAVGDVNFQQKCFWHMRSLKEKGVTIVLVTHDTSTVKAFCTRAMWLHDGVIREDGDAIETVDAYLSYMSDEQVEKLQAEEDKKQEEKQTEEAAEPQEDQQRRKDPEAEDPQSEDPELVEKDPNHYGSGDVVITDAYLVNAKGKRAKILRQGEPAMVEVHYEIKKPKDGYCFGVGFLTMKKEYVYGVNTNIDELYIKDLPDKGCVKFHMDKLPLMEDMFYLQVCIDSIDMEPLDYHIIYNDFKVIAKKSGVGVAFIEHSWEIPQPKENA
ncbi:ABC transporter ATP-binding protein [Christensenellaceae bacterium OttesenSCG-928-K19]|nr:ABC transporter ATP-binding protein [Christensenellaceae bacterium OttesenSCG-928-K19]